MPTSDVIFDELVGLDILSALAELVPQGDGFGDTLIQFQFGLIEPKRYEHALAEIPSNKEHERKREYGEELDRDARHVFL